MRKSAFILLLCTLSFISLAQRKYSVQSPDGRIHVSVEFQKKITYSVNLDGKQIISPSSAELLIQNQPALTKVSKTQSRSVSETIVSSVPEKRKTIPDVYNELTIQMREPVSIVFRAYNDGVAYRWLTKIKDSIIIVNEWADINFPQPHPVYFPEVQKRADVDSFISGFEELYSLKPMDSITEKSLMFSPILVAPTAGPKILVTESDIDDYPGMFLRGKGSSGLKSAFAPYPIEEEITGGEFKQATVKKRGNFIAHTIGTRSFPWRVLAISKEDKELPNNDIVYRLASPSRIGDASWVKPGQATDEWIIGINLFNIPFKSGINTATYKYYVDFAAKFGIERIMLDAGWSDYSDLLKVNPNLNVEELAAYAKSKGVKLSMWTLSMTLDQQLEPALEQFSRWGVDFIMTDFMDRDDQKMVNFYKRIAEACARHKIMIMFHGAYKPAGFNRTYPNAITREGVLGSEYNIWSDKPTPEHNILLPFIRMVAGPMDYEPGILDNATKETFRPIGNKVMSIGTRTNQLAMFVVYESPISIFSGNPSQGLLEPAFMELLGSIPTVWDETIVLDAKVGDYIITARKKDNDWFIGSMTDWTARSLNVNLDFLDAGEYEATICEDGINADRYASDYKLTKKTVRKGDQLQINLAPGGGYVMRLRKK